MKTSHLALIISILVLITSSQLAAQSTCSDAVWELDVTDPANDISCGTIINSAIWAVWNRTCTLTTPTLDFSDQGCGAIGNIAVIGIRMDKSGGADATDYILNRIYCGSVIAVEDTIWGDWVPDAGNSNVRTQYYAVPCSEPMVLFVEMYSDDNTDKLYIFNGGTCMQCTGAILPVQITSFTGENHGNAVELHWTTASEMDVVEYVLERAGGDGQYVAIGTTEPLGTDGNSYAFVDDEPIPGQAYYRLRIIETGETVYSSTIVVETPVNPSLSVFPNPATPQGFTITPPNAESVTYQVNMYDMNGVKQLSQTFVGDEHGSPFQINQSEIPAGLYIVELLSSTVRHHTILTIQ